MCLYLRAKFEVPSIILTVLDKGGVILPPPPTSKRTPNKIIVLEKCYSGKIVDTEKDNGLGDNNIKVNKKIEKK